MLDESPGEDGWRSVLRQPFFLAPTRSSHGQGIVVILVVLVLLAHAVILTAGAGRSCCPVLLFVFQHPCEPVRLLFDRKHLSCILLQASWGLPQLHRRLGAVVLQRPISEVGRLLRGVLLPEPEELLESLKLDSVALGDRNLDGDGAAVVL